MKYLSTRDAGLRFDSAAAIVQGLSRDGGLFVPSSFPVFSLEEIEELRRLSYAGRAARLMGSLLEDFTLEELQGYADRAYAFGTKFDHEDAAPVVRIDKSTAILELWHGPTCAFKDMALQMLPYLLTASMRKTGEKKTVCILVATSGDTGKAALEGFRDVEGTRILVFYPRDGVSDIQKLQMVTQEGGNVGVEAVRGNFDDAQTGVKKIFSDSRLRETLAGRGYSLSSANSINWGRVMPQIVYYFSSYCDLVSDGTIRMGDKVNFCVPTGNFGDILAGYYARCMGLPVNRLICASNSNNVLTDFIRTGIYDRNREFHTTISPSMDILISSNLERLLFHMTGSDEKVRTFMSELERTGRYQVEPETLEAVQELFWAGWSSEEETKNAIARLYGEEGYLMDPHTAVAWNVLREYRNESRDSTVSVVLSTASPYKFCSSVLEALGTREFAEGTAIFDQLADKTRTTAPLPLRSLGDKEIRFRGETDREAMEDRVLEFLA